MREYLLPDVSRKHWKAGEIVMTGKYDKNFTEQGYLMNYHHVKKKSPWKNYVLQFVVTLKDVDPPVWRKIQVPTDYNFWELHVAIQDSMGWRDYHLHHFEIKGKGKKKKVRIGIPDFNGFIDDEHEVYPGWEIAVLDHFNELGVRADYIYDYGDDWNHRVLLEGYIFREKGNVYPRCIGGARECPPEDCGGVSGYDDLLLILKDKNHELYEQYSAWVGGNYNPERFDLKSIQFDDPYKRWVNAFLQQ